MALALDQVDVTTWGFEGADASGGAAHNSGFSVLFLFCWSKRENYLNLLSKSLKKEH